MPHPEEDYEFSCPYCVAVQSIRLDMTAGNRQTFVIDCENCCRPIEIEMEIESDGTIHFIAKREGEG